MSRIFHIFVFVLIFLLLFAFAFGVIIELGDINCKLFSFDR